MKPEDSTVFLNTVGSVPSFIRKHVKKDPVHSKNADVKIDKPKITIFDYTEKGFIEKQDASIEESLPFREKPSVTWINVDGIHDSSVIEQLGLNFGLHPLVLEEIQNTNQRSKIEDYGDYIYLVLKMFHSGHRKEDIIMEQVSLILGSNFVLSFQETLEGDVFDPIRERIRTSKGRIRKLGADYLSYAMIDLIVDYYFVVLETLGEKIELLEDEVATSASSKTLHLIHTFKKDMLYLRRAIWPLREVIAGLDRGESSLVKKATRYYLRDVYDHTVQVIDNTETYRDMLSGMLDIYLSSINNRLNEIIKLLTIITTIFMPLSFIAGVYGMNFRFMPELEHPYGYPAVLILMALVALSMLVYFRKRKWI